jgi:hypothetical protein
MGVLLLLWVETPIPRMGARMGVSHDVLLAPAQ